MAKRQIKVPEDILVVGLVSGGHFFSHFFGLVLPPLMFPITRDLGIGYAEFGILIAAMAAAAAVTQIPAGVLVDRWGPVWPLIAGLVLRSVPVLLMGLSSTYFELLVLAVVSGVGNSVFHPANYSILSAQVCSSWIGRAFGVHTFAGHLGWALAPVTMGLISTMGSWRVALFASGLAGLAMGLVLLLQRHRLRGAVLARETDAASKTGNRGGALQLHATVPLVFVAAVFLLDAAAMKGFQTYFVPVVMATHGTTLALAGMLLSLFFAGSAIGVLIGGFSADRTSGHRRLAGASLAGTAVLIAAIGATSGSTVFLFALTGAAGLCHGLLPPFRDMILRSIAPLHATGRTFAFVSVGFDIGSAVAPLLFGMVLDAGKPLWVFWSAAICLLVAGLAVMPAKASIQSGLRDAGSAGLSGFPLSRE